MASTALALAGGSVTGRLHVAAGRPNQDAWHWVATDAALVACVCDGCGSSPHSELGAQLGARLLASALHAALLTRPASDPLPPAAACADALASATRVTLRRLGALARAMGDPEAVVADCLLFTVLGLAVGADTAFTFGLGDGLLEVNGRRRVLGPWPGNAPPYLGYALLPPDRHPWAADALRPRVYDVLPAAELTSAALATDGVLGGEEAAPGLVAGWLADDRVFTNPDGLRRRLAQANREADRIDWQARRVERTRGRFDDDATLVLVRRRPDSRQEESGCRSM